MYRKIIITKESFLTLGKKRFTNWLKKNIRWEKKSALKKEIAALHLKLLENNELLVKAKIGSYVVQFGDPPKFLDINDSLVKELGYSKAEFLSMDPSTLFADDHNKNLFIQRMLLMLNGQKVEANVDYKIKRKDGSELWTSLQIEIIHDAHGNPCGAKVLAREVTERKEIELALKESEEKFKLVSEQSVLGLAIIQGDKYQYVNKAAAAMIGFSCAEVLNWPAGEFAKFVHPDDLAFVTEQAKKKQKGNGKQTTNYTFMINTKTGTVKHLEIYSKTVTYQGKNADLISFNDVTERTLTTEALSASEEKYRALVENSKDIVAITNIDPLKIVLISTAVTEMTGYSQEEVIFFPITAFFTEEALIKIDQTLKNELENDHLRKPNRSILLELEQYHKKGHKIWIELRLSFLRDKNGNPTRILSSARDISERKKAEAEIIRSQKELETLNAELEKRLIEIESLVNLTKELDKSVRSTAHEIRNPLAGIMAAAQVGLRKIDKLLEQYGVDNMNIQHARRNFKNIQGSAMRLNEILTNILDLAKLEAGKMEILFEKDVDITTVISEALVENQDNFDNKGIDVELQRTNLPTLMEINKFKIGQVIRNLLSNALSFTPKGKKITISLQHGYLLGKENSLRIDIKNEGPNIPDQEKNKIFSLWEQAETPVERVGSGLGLAICHEIIKKHHGSISFDNIDGGMIFHFTLPYEQ